MARCVWNSARLLALGATRNGNAELDAALDAGRQSTEKVPREMLALARRGDDGGPLPSLGRSKSKKVVGAKVTPASLTR